jgi:hypothetical protein
MTHWGLARLKRSARTKTYAVEVVAGALAVKVALAVGLNVRDGVELLEEGADGREHRASVKARKVPKIVLLTQFLCTGRPRV